MLFCLIIVSQFLKFRSVTGLFFVVGYSYELAPLIVVKYQLSGSI